MEVVAHHVAVPPRTSKPKTSPIGVRLEVEMLDDIDAIAQELSRPGLDVTRADVIRVLVHESLEARRKAAARKK